MQKRRGGPRSRVVEAIAVLLLSRPMRASEIASILGFPTRYISSYLSYWKTRGLFEYENGYWKLTEAGREYAETVLEKYQQGIEDKFVLLARQILSSHTSEARTGKNEYHQPGYSATSLPFIASLTSRIDNERQKRRACAQQFIAIYRPMLSEDEVEILNALLDHYVEWGRTYTYIDQLQATLNADTTWLLKLLRALQAKGLIYIYQDRRLGVRIGLSREAKRLLESCLSDPQASPGATTTTSNG